MDRLTVTFGEGRGIVIPLEVRSPAEAIPHTDVSALLFSLRVQVLETEEHLEADDAIQRFLVCEFDGGPLRSQRRRAILTKLTSALESVVARTEGTRGPGLATAGTRGTARHAA